MQVRSNSEKQQLEPDIEKRTGSKLRKDYVKAIYCHLAYLISMQSTSCEMPGWTKHKLESRLLGQISITSECYQTFCCQRESHSTNKPLALLLHSERDHCWLSSLVPSSAIRQDPLTVLTGEDLLGFILISYPRPSGVCIVMYCVRSGEDTKPYRIYVLSLQIKWHG